MPDHEHLHHAAETLAEQLTSHPTLPQSLQSSHSPDTIAQSGIWIGTSACDFKDCPWQRKATPISDIRSRNGVEHPWGQELQKHICTAHGPCILLFLREFKVQSDLR